MKALYPLIPFHFHLAAILVYGAKHGTNNIKLNSVNIQFNKVSAVYPAQADNNGASVLEVCTVFGETLNIYGTMDEWNEYIMKCDVVQQTLYPTISPKYCFVTKVIIKPENITMDTRGYYEVGYIHPFTISKVEVAEPRGDATILKVTDVYGNSEHVEMTFSEWKACIVDAEQYTKLHEKEIERIERRSAEFKSLTQKEPEVKTSKVSEVDNDINYKIDVMRAYRDGKIIEYLDNDKWYPIDQPSWNWPKVQYRVQEEIRDSIDWSHVHSDYKWLVRDKNNKAWLLKSNPELTDTGWKLVIPGPSVEAESFTSYVKGNVKWQHSICQRPLGK